MALSGTTQEQWVFCMCFIMSGGQADHITNLLIQSPWNRVGMAGGQEEGRPGAPVGNRGMGNERRRCGSLDGCILVGHGTDGLCSNCWQIGDGRKAKNEMPFFGVTRYAGLLTNSQSLVKSSPSVLHARSNTSWWHSTMQRRKHVYLWPRPKSSSLSRGTRLFGRLAPARAMTMGTSKSDLDHYKCRPDRRF